MCVYSHLYAGQRVCACVLKSHYFKWRFSLPHTDGSLTHSFPVFTDLTALIDEQLKTILYDIIQLIKNKTSASPDFPPSLQGVEVTVNASSLDDVEPSAIGQRLTNGTVAVASPVLSRLKTREEEHGDVVCL